MELFEALVDLPVRRQICPARGDGLQKLGEGGELLARDLVHLGREARVELQQQLVQLHGEDGDRAVVSTRISPRFIFMNTKINQSNCDYLGDWLQDETR